MKKVILYSSLLGLFGSCASTPSIDALKATNDKEAEVAYKAARKGNSKFLFDEFSDSYKGENKIKKIAIAYYSIGWGYSKDAEDISNAPTLGHYKEDYKKLVSASMMEMKKTFEGLGYQVVLPDELAEMSPTFKSLKTSNDFVTVTPVHGKSVGMLDASGSRYIDKITHEGKLLSQINKEASSVDAFIGLTLQSIGDAATGWYLDNENFMSVKTTDNAFSFICVSREKAQKNGVKLGWFGDANDCARAQAEYSTNYYLGSDKDKGKPIYSQIKATTFGNLDRIYKNVSRGIVENFYNEGMK